MAKFETPNGHFVLPGARPVELADGSADPIGESDGFPGFDVLIPDPIFDAILVGGSEFGNGGVGLKAADDG